MSIDPISRNNKSSPLHKASPKGKKAKTSESGSSPVDGTSETPAIHSLLSELDHITVVRQNIVELGRKLAQSPDYPNEEQQKRLAHALLSPLEQLIQEDTP